MPFRLDAMEVKLRRDFGQAADQHLRNERLRPDMRPCPKSETERIWKKTERRWTMFQNLKAAAILLVLDAKEDAAKNEVSA